MVLYYVNIFLWGIGVDYILKPHAATSREVQEIHMAAKPPLMTIAVVVLMLLNHELALLVVDEYTWSVSYVSFSTDKTCSDWHELVE